MVAQPVWDTGVTADVVNATYAVVDVLEDVLESLAGYYPPNHFDSMNPRDYFSEVIAARARWHRHIAEPSGHGKDGTIVHTVVAGAVLADVERMVAQLVHSLTLNWADTGHTEFSRWETDWYAVRAVDDYGLVHQKVESSKPKMKWGCYQFEGEEPLYCIKCYETQGRKHPTTRVNSRQRQCAVCQAVVHA
jgi:hypothetical protein